MEQWKNKDGKIITANRSRPRRVVLHLSDEEYEAFCSKAAACGMSKQEYARRSILDVHVPVMNTDGIIKMLPEISRISNNLNQIAKRLNARGFVDYKGELATALKGCEDLWQSLKQFLRERP